MTTCRRCKTLYRYIRTYQEILHQYYALSQAAHPLLNHDVLNMTEWGHFFGPIVGGNRWTRLKIVGLGIQFSEPRQWTKNRNVSSLLTSL